jgi:hypothetical protein
MIEAFGKSCHLDTENLLASSLHVTTLGNKGMGIDITCKHKVLWSNGLSRDIQSVSTSLGIDKRSVLTTLSTELLDIYLTHTDLWLEGEALALDKEFSILEDHRISTIYHILSRLSETTAGINISANGTCTLLSQQTTQIIVLTDELVAGREIQDDISSGKGEVITWRYGSPHILADLDTKLHTIACGEEYWLRAYMNRTTSKVYVSRIKILGRSKPTLLVELPIVRKICLWYDAKNLTTLDDYCAIVEQAVNKNRSSNDKDSIELTGKIEKLQDTLFRLV